MMISWQVSVRDFAVSDVVEGLRTGQRLFDSMFYNQVMDSPGLYSFWLRGRCLYVGMSIDLKRRIGEHCTDETNISLRNYLKSYPNEIMISFVYRNSDPARLRRMEADAIKKLNPISNDTPNLMWER